MTGQNYGPLRTENIFETQALCIDLRITSKNMEH